jgi:hypothetical protein
MAATIIMALIAAALAATGAGVAGVRNSNRKNARDEDIERIKSTLGVSDSEARDIIAAGGYYDEPDASNLWGLFGDKYDSRTSQSDLEDYLKVVDELGPMPDDVDMDAVFRMADAEVDAENQQILDLYDKMYNQELDTSNDMYNDAVNQILYNDAMNQNAIRQNARSEMDRQQRNAIVRGASAATRLVANINAQLGTQAQAAQQSLETSNNLAKMLLNQRDAAMRTRRDYANSQADLMRDNLERKAHYRSMRLEEAEALRKKKLDKWNAEFDSRLAGNPYGNVYKRRETARTTGNSGSTYDYKNGGNASY